MKKIILLLFLPFIIIVIVSCTRAPQYIYEKDAIVLKVKSDPRLNLYQNNPHTILLCLYQFIDPNAFNQLLDEKDGLQKLLECSRFDPSVTSAKSFFVLPNGEKMEKIDRVEGTKYVGLIAGYYNLLKENVTHFVPIPVSSFGSKPKVLNINLYLGPQGIEGVARSTEDYKRDTKAAHKDTKEIYKDTKETLEQLRNR
jgi:predicted component of type VI protein secretion system